MAIMTQAQPRPQRSPRSLTQGRRGLTRSSITRSGGTSAVVEWLRNETTGKRLYLNYALQSGETLTIDLTPGARQITSSYRGAVWEAALRNSDLGDFYLLPGDNDISAFVNQAGSPTMTAFMKFPIAHESADGVA